MDTNYSLTLKGEVKANLHEVFWDLVLYCTGSPPQRTRHCGFRHEAAFSIPEFTLLTNYGKFLSILMVAADEVCPFGDSIW